MRLVYLLLAPVTVFAGVAGIAVAPTAVADCTSSGGTTICSQGDSRGANSGDGPSGSGPYVPYPCDINWYDCDNYMEWGVDFDVDLDPGRPGIGGPGGPGRPGGPGIGPGRPGGGGGGFGGGGGRGGGRGGR